MTKDEYLETEAWWMSIPVESVRAHWHASLASAWHSLGDSDRAELDARPPAPGRPRFVSAGVTLRPTQGFMDLVSGAADDAVEGKQ